MQYAKGLDVEGKRNGGKKVSDSVIQVDGGGIY